MHVFSDVNGFDSSSPASTLHMLRQQLEKDTPDQPYLSLADFVAPRSAGRDHVGMFAVSVFGCDELVEK